VTASAVLADTVQHWRSVGCGAQDKISVYAQAYCSYNRQQESLWESSSFPLSVWH